MILGSRTVALVRRSATVALVAWACLVSAGPCGGEPASGNPTPLAGPSAQSTVTWPPRSLTGVFKLDRPDEISPVCQFRADGYVVCYRFTRRDGPNVVLFDGRYRFGKPVDASRCELVVDGVLDFPSGSGVFTLLPAESGRTPGFVFQMGKDNLTFLGANEVELQQLLNGSQHVDDKRTIGKSEDWSVVPSVREAVSQTLVTVEAVRKHLVGVWQMPTGPDSADIESFDAQGRITFHGFKNGYGVFGGNNDYTQGKVRYRLAARGREPGVLVVVDEKGVEAPAYIVEGIGQDLLVMRALHYETKKPLPLKVYGRTSAEPIALEAAAPKKVDR
jgi:hypothetical protein